MSEPTGSGSDAACSFRRLDHFCDEFERAWKGGGRPRIEHYLAAARQPERAALLRELLVVELAYRRRGNETLVLQEYKRRFPDHSDVIQAVFASQLAGAEDASTRSFEIGPEPGPPALGRYGITAVLGKGGFGVVYRGYDKELRREVAIKVPHRHRVSQPQDVEAYLAEARVLASLDHPHIVPVFDVGRTPDGLCFIVSKFIEGCDLKQAQGTLSITQAVELLARVAEALHYAHRKGLVHRDVKPGNILLDPATKPYLTDFGLALREEDFGRGAEFAGTPVYMSPEQARGEGHRVDGRSDIFSIGVVFYELLTGRRPFRGETGQEVLEQITCVEPRPPRQIVDTLPRELEQICLKALAKRVTERYTTAQDLADDLRRFLQDRRHDVSGPIPGNLLQMIWHHLEPGLQDAFLLAYNKKLREGSQRISTRDLFQALTRVQDPSLQALFADLPHGSLPEPIPAGVPIARHVLDDGPPLADCVADSLNHFLHAGPLPRKVGPADLFVDIGKHGHGPSVARLREHGVTPEELERRVRKAGLSVLRPRPAS
jgi:serine/threonine protein kinase